MDLKKVCKKSSAKKKMMSIELKREIIEKHEQGVRVVDLSRQYGRSTSMICSVLKRKESIKSVTPAKGLTIISKLRTSLHENMEKLLMVWVTEKQLQGDTLTQTIICEKARAIYGDLLKQTPQTSIDEASEESFKASRGWFENFKKRSGIHSVVRHEFFAAHQCATAHRLPDTALNRRKPARGGLVNSFAYRMNDPSLRTCKEWFKRFKFGDFNVNDKEHVKLAKMFEDEDLQALLDEHDAQTQEQLAASLIVSRQPV
ncbi:hypothetical protein LAZ67_20001281 [Cordylochernes scorpioides]|uniref:HTH CENPB-type domain-containing protein n=1 Tax=Cordylochernes scorpioides TaxID=51811 RepID=A0ABY6LLJ2_9ARAC|nr:hypothetical protein LAZ67_20001281 [Cordylochernes scorpioides]